MEGKDQTDSNLPVELEIIKTVMQRIAKLLDEKFLQKKDLLYYSKSMCYANF
jgi:hypothetical protein